VIRAVHQAAGGTLKTKFLMVISLLLSLSLLSAAEVKADHLDAEKTGQVGVASTSVTPAGDIPAGADSAGDTPAGADSAGDTSTGDNLWRIAYVEAGSYRDYHLNLLALASGLEKLGLIENGRPSASEITDTASLWRWLAQNAGGNRLVFHPDHYYSADWDDAKYPGMKSQVLSGASTGEIDLILAFGTIAGKLLATNEHQTPVLSITATDPVAAGISKTVESSGLDHVHVQVVTGQIERQLSMFHNIFGFKTLGVPYDLTSEGQSTMGVPTIERLAKELGFEIVSCQTKLEISDSEEANRNLVDCLRRLSRESEAVYLTVSNGVIESRMPEILAPLIENRVPSFSQKGPSETKLGVLMSLAEDDFMSSGQFEAEVIREVLAGRPPGSLNQVYVAPLTMALNIKMAMDIGWNPPFKILAAIDELYTPMASPPNQNSASQ
jgi:ABC-type uncharacterized transport system substrate-binding protein